MKKEKVEYTYWKVEKDQVVYEDEYDIVKIESFNKGPKAIRINYTLEEKDSGIISHKHCFVRNLGVIYQTDDTIYINNYDVAEELFGINVEDNTFVVTFDIEVDEDNRWDSEEFNRTASEAVKVKHS